MECRSPPSVFLHPAIFQSIVCRAVGNPSRIQPESDSARKCSEYRTATGLHRSRAVVLVSLAVSEGEHIHAPADALIVAEQGGGTHQIPAALLLLPYAFADSCSGSDSHLESFHCDRGFGFTVPEYLARLRDFLHD